MKTIEITVCPHCNAPTVERFVGDEGLTYCSEDCGCIEGEAIHKEVCSDCDEETCACTKPVSISLISETMPLNEWPLGYLQNLLLDLKASTLAFSQTYDSTAQIIEVVNKAIKDREFETNKINQL